MIALTMSACSPKRVSSARHLGLISNEPLAEYLIVITDRERFGGISTNDIWHAKEFEIIPLDPNMSVQNPSHPVEAYLLALVKSHLNGGSFFFSHTWDLSRRLQVQWLSEKADVGKAMWEVVRVMCNRLRRRIKLNSLSRPTIDFSGTSKHSRAQQRTQRLTTSQVPAVEVY
jgi:hypothetical protein